MAPSEVMIPDVCTQEPQAGAAGDEIIPPFGEPLLLRAVTGGAAVGIGARDGAGATVETTSLPEP